MDPWTCFLFITLASLSSTLGELVEQQPLVVVCNFASWAKWRPIPMDYDVQDIPGDKCTHIIYNFAGLNDNYSLLLEDPVNDPKRIKMITGLKAKWPRLKILLGFGGNTQGGRRISVMASTDSTRRRFINSVVLLMLHNDLDGLAISWRFPGSLKDDREKFVLLVKELRREFNKEFTRRMFITAAVPIDRKLVEKWYDVPQLSLLLDQIHVIGYNLRKFEDNFVDVHSPLFPRKHVDGSAYFELNIHQGMKMWLESGSFRHKLVVGIPFYGQSYTLAKVNSTGLHDGTKGQGVPGQFTRISGALAYYEICPGVQSGNWTRRYDPEGMVPYAFYNHQWVGYEDEESIGAKMDYILKEGFAGAMIWTIDYDDFRGVCGRKNPLLTAMNYKLSGHEITVHKMQALETEQTMSVIREEANSETNPTNIILFSVSIVIGVAILASVAVFIMKTRVGKRVKLQQHPESESMDNQLPLLKDKSRKPSSESSDDGFVGSRDERRDSRLKDTIDRWLISSERVQFGRKVGDGSFGIVFKGNCHGAVALKKLHSVGNPSKKDIKSFETEVAILSETRHPNIVLFIGFVRETLTIVTEWCDGLTLYKHIHEMEDEFTQLQIISIAKQVAQGMSYLHSIDILHRDLKSPNIFLRGSDLEVKIGDFGLATVKPRIKPLNSIDSSSVSESIQQTLSIFTSTGTNPKGTILWMAPEVIKSHTYSNLSDVYSFGVVLYELLVKELPFKNLPPEVILWQVAKGLLKIHFHEDDLDTHPILIHLLQTTTTYEPCSRLCFGDIVKMIDSEFAPLLGVSVFQLQPGCGLNETTAIVY